MILDDTIKKVEQYIWDCHMLSRGDRVVMGVSGGADSMCLLFVLMELKEKMDLSLCAVHVNHGIRGEKAKRDQEFVENFCSSHGILWKTFRGDIPKLAQTWKMSQEEAGRTFRYQCFDQALKDLDWENGKIAVAHHENDVAETFLMNIFRGSGIHGLTGICPVRGNVIRPLLNLDRQEIENFLTRKNISFCTDDTNFENTYTRNRIRNVLIPYIQEYINSRGVDHMADLARENRELAQYMDKERDKAWDTVIRPDKSLDADRLKSLDPVLAREVLRRWIGEAAGRLKDITREHIHQVMGLICKPVGKQTVLPYGLIVERGYDSLKFVGPGNKQISGFEEIPLEISKETGIITSVPIKNAGFTVEMVIRDPGENQRIEENRYTKWMDYDKIENRLQLRHRCPGDYLIVDKKGSRKLLRRVMIDDKIPKEERDKLMLIADGSHVLWIIGGRMSESCKVTGDTKKILEIKIKGEK